MPTRRATLEVFGALLLAGSALPVGAAAFVAPAPVQNTRVSSAPLTLRERVSSAGTFDVSVDIDPKASSGGEVRLDIGSLRRRARRVTPGHPVVVNVRLPILGRSLTIRAYSERAMPKLSVTLRRVPPADSTTRASSGGPLGPSGPTRGSTAAGGGSGAPASATHTAGSTGLAPSSGSTGSLGSTGTLTSAASTGASGSSGSGGSGSSGSTGSSGSAGSSGPGSGATGSSGSSGSSGSTGASGSSGASPSGGAPTISHPATFAPIASYASLARDFEFNGPSLPAGWAAGNAFNWGFAGTEWMSSQVSMTGSSVALTAIHRTSPNGSANESGWISTSGGYSFQYGMVDYRAKLPAGQGLWSGLWMINPGYPTTGELDISEQLLGNLRTVYGSAHAWNGNTHLWGETQTGQLSSDATGWHDYQLIWQPGLLTWAIDGVAYAQYSRTQATSWPFDTDSMYLIADLAVAGPSEWGGPPNASTLLPSTMQIQSVKVWQ